MDASRLFVSLSSRPRARLLSGSRRLFFVEKRRRGALARGRRGAPCAEGRDRSGAYWGDHAHRGERGPGIAILNIVAKVLRAGSGEARDRREPGRACSPVAEPDARRRRPLRRRRQPGARARSHIYLTDLLPSCRRAIGSRGRRGRRGEARSGIGAIVDGLHSTHDAPSTCSRPRPRTARASAYRTRGLQASADLARRFARRGT